MNHQASARERAGDHTGCGRASVGLHRDSLTIYGLSLSLYEQPEMQGETRLSQERLRRRSGNRQNIDERMRRCETTATLQHFCYDFVALAEMMRGGSGERAQTIKPGQSS